MDLNNEILNVEELLYHADELESVAIFYVPDFGISI